MTEENSVDVFTVRTVTEYRDVAHRQRVSCNEEPPPAPMFHVVDLRATPAQVVSVTDSEEMAHIVRQSLEDYREKHLKKLMGFCTCTEQTYWDAIRKFGWEIVISSGIVGDSMTVWVNDVNAKSPDTSGAITVTGTTLIAALREAVSRIMERRGE